MDLNADDVIARFPGLEPLVAMSDPPWRFATLTSGVLTGTRAHGTYTEGLWIINERRTGAHRRPISGRLGPVVAEANFAGTLSDAVALLARPVRWEDDQ
jgi:hypothetical protein